MLNTPREIVTQSKQATHRRLHQHYVRSYDKLLYSATVPDPTTTLVLPLPTPSDTELGPILSGCLSDCLNKGKVD